MRHREEENEIVREICVFKPNTVNDEREVGDTLLTGRTVLLSLEKFDFADSQRILDFSAGVCCAIDGSMVKISDYIFAICPPGVDVTGDIAGVPELAAKRKKDEDNVKEFDISRHSGHMAEK